MDVTYAARQRLLNITASMAMGHMADHNDFAGLPGALWRLWGIRVMSARHECANGGRFDRTDGYFLPTGSDDHARALEVLAEHGISVSDHD